MTTVQTIEGDTVDRLCWAHYGRTQGVVEIVLAANPGLRHFSAELPAGTAVSLPEIAPVAATRATIRLWS